MKDEDKTKEQLIEELRKLRQELHLYETIAEKMPLALAVWKLEDLDDPSSFRLIACNPQIEKATGAPYREFIGMTVRETFPSSLKTEGPHIYAEAVRTGQMQESPDLHFPGDEQTAAGVYSVTAVPVGSRILATFCENITERKRVEEKIEHLNAVLRAIRNVNQLITRERDRDRLLQGACESLVKTRGYYSAWIALLDESGVLMTIAEAGLGEEFLLLVEQLKRGGLPACGRMALLQSGVVAIEDRVSACADCPLSKNYVGKGTMTIRLEYGEKVYGLLTVSVPGDLVADEEEQALFREVAADIAFALHVIELEEERRQAEEALRERVKELGCLYGIADLVQKPGISLEETLQGIVDLIPPAWQYPEITCARIILEGQEFGTENFRETVWKQASDIVVRGKRIGAVEVCYLEERPESDAGPFLKEERYLISAIAERLGRIAERKRAEEALAHEQFLLQILMDNLPDHIYFKDADSRFIRINKAQAKWFGLSDPAQAVGKTDFDFFTKEHARQAYADEQEVMRSGQPLVGIEEKETWPDGRETWVSTTKMPMRDKEGQIIGTFGISRDITERKRAEEALRESEAKYRHLLKNIPQKIFYKDRNSVYVAVNPSYACDFHIAPEDVVGKTDHDLFSRELADKYRADDKRIMQAGIAEELDEQYLKNGEEFAVHTVKTPVFDDEGNVIGILGIFWDITERKRAEEALRVSEERFALAVQGSNDGVWDWDIQNKSLYWSPRLKELLGYADDELDVDFDTFESHLHPDDREHTRAAIEAHLKDQGLYDVEQRLRTKSGEYRWFRARGQALWDEAGDPLRMVGSTTDITERKRAEEALQEYSERLEEMVDERTQELRDAQEQLVRQERLAVLGQMAGGVSHELRNPLGVISNAVYFLQMTLLDADETTREYLEMISLEVHNSEKVISDLLDFSRTRFPDREEIAVSELVAEVLEKHPPPENVKVITEITPDLPPVYIDPRQIGQVLGNLVVNAYQAMPEGGTLTVKRARLSPRPEARPEGSPKSGEVSLSITDTGMGIPQENKAKLFEPLFTTKTRGIGLGLTISKILVEANGGSIEVESEVGRGSTFTVRLPLSDR